MVTYLVEHERSGDGQAGGSERRESDRGRATTRWSRRGVLHDGKTLGANVVRQDFDGLNHK